MVVDFFNDTTWKEWKPALYVGCNGGGAVLRIGLNWFNNSFPITGYPFSTPLPPPSLLT